MHVTVDRSLCQDHGQCCIAAPAVFTLNDDGVLEYDASPDDSELENVEAAADVCPAQAITFEVTR
ncbi:ferredoxin [Mycolicibacterium palauense]|uniref:ferredoxin n=1 Tax=Mycolicibacterium palauense TaxID=2034511 RepID=UPI000BFEB8BC|nr:ferredoxin [Mycolicibacterium palauense]